MTMPPHDHLRFLRAMRTHLIEAGHPEQAAEVTAWMSEVRAGSDRWEQMAPGSTPTRVSPPLDVPTTRLVELLRAAAVASAERFADLIGDGAHGPTFDQQSRQAARVERLLEEAADRLADQ